LKRKLRTTGNENAREWFVSARSRTLTVSETLIQEHKSMAQEGAKKLGKREPGASYKWLESFRKWQIVLNEVCGETFRFCEESVADCIVKPIINETCMQRKNPVPCGSVTDWFYYVKIQFIPHREHSWLPLEMALGQIFFRVRLFSPVSFIPIMHHTYFHLHVTLTRRTNRRCL